MESVQTKEGSQIPTPNSLVPITKMPRHGALLTYIRPKQTNVGMPGLLCKATESYETEPVELTFFGIAARTIPFGRRIEEGADIPPFSLFAVVAIEDGKKGSLYKHGRSWIWGMENSYIPSFNYPEISELFSKGERGDFNNLTFFRVPLIHLHRRTVDSQIDEVNNWE